MRATQSPQQELNRRQEAALVALLEKGTVKEAAAACGLSEATLFRYLQDKAFLDRYREARLRLVETAVAKLQVAADSAVNTLREIAEDKEAAPTARIAAARAIIIHATRGVEWAQKGAGSAAEEHLHLCNGCLERFSCPGKECADFEFARCPQCAKLPHERGVTPRTKPTDEAAGYS